VGQERCVSGSGTNKTTHTNVLREETFVIDNTREVVAGHPHDIRSAVTLPATSAFSFDTSDNHLEWYAEVRIALTRYPDWKEKVELQMVPATFVEQAPPSVSRAAPEVRVSVARMVHSEAEPRATGALPEPEAAAEVLAEPTAAAGETGDLRPLTKVLEALSQFSYFDSRREAMIASKAHAVFDCSIVIDQMASTFGDVDDPLLADGRTIVGTVPGTEHKIQVLTLASDNEWNDALSGGEVWSGRVRLAKWDSLFNHAVLHQA